MSGDEDDVPLNPRLVQYAGVVERYCAYFLSPAAFDGELIYGTAAFAGAANVLNGKMLSIPLDLAWPLNHLIKADRLERASALR